MAHRAAQPQLPRHEDDVLPESPGSGVTPMDLAIFALQAARKRVLLAAAVAIVGISASIAYYATRAPFYRVEASVLANRSQALPSAVRNLFDDSPSRSAWEVIHRRENLIALVKRANLLAEGAPPPPLGLREKISRALRGPGATTKPADPFDTMVSVLDQLLVVTVEDNTINIHLDWGDPRQAYDIVDGALQNFLEARHVQEVTAIDEVIAVLQGRAVALRKELDRAMEDARRRPAPAPRAPPRPRQASEELYRLQSALESKQRAIQDLEEVRKRRLADLTSQLDQARNTLSDAHPTVIALRQQIDGVKRDSPQIDALREDERKLRKQYADRSALEGVATAGALPVMPPEPAAPAVEEDQRVREARVQYEQIDARLGAALVERDAARAAFKYRYNVIWPPQMPTAPTGPNPVKILGAGTIASFLLALAAALAPDILRGRIVQPWQVQHLLELPLLGDFEEKR